MLYAWRVNGLFKADAQEIGEALEALDLKPRNGVARERIPFDEIWAAAQKSNSPFHDILTHDKDEALRKLNRRELKAMLQQLVVGRRVGQKVVPTKTRAFLYVYPGDTDTKVYMRRQKVNQTPSLRAQRTRNFYRQLRNLAVEHDGNPEVEKYIKRIKAIIDQMHTQMMEHV